MYTYVVPTPFSNFNPGLIQADKLQTECYLIEQWFWFCKKWLVSFNFMMKTDNYLYNNNYPYEEVADPIKIVLNTHIV